MMTMVTLDGGYRRCACGAVNFKDAKKCRLEHDGQPHQLGEVISGLPTKGTYDGF